KTQLELLIGHAKRQTYTGAALYVVLAPELAEQANTAPPGIRLLPYVLACNYTIEALVGQSDMVAGMVPEDYYGPNYLLDIALATHYSDAAVIGKGAYFALV